MATTMLADGFGFVEGPRWRVDRLFFSDMGTKRVLTVDLDGHVEEVCEVEARPSGIGWLPDGRMLVVSVSDKRVLRLEADGTLVEHADLSGLASAPCNDMVVDARGNAYVGNPGYDMRNPPSPLPNAELVLVRPDGTAEVVSREVRFPNGPAVTPDGTTLIVAETMAARLSAFAIHDDGTLGERRTYADLPGRAPDGIALDAEGAVWVADADNEACVRVREGGEVTDVVEPGRHCFLRPRRPRPAHAVRPHRRGLHRRGHPQAHGRHRDRRGRRARRRHPLSRSLPTARRSTRPWGRPGTAACRRAASASSSTGRRGTSSAATSY